MRDKQQNLFSIAASCTPSDRGDNMDLFDTRHSSRSNLVAASEQEMTINLSFEFSSRFNYLFSKRFIENYHSQGLCLMIGKG